MARTRSSPRFSVAQRLGAGVVGIAALAAATLTIAGPAVADDPAEPTPVETCVSAVVVDGAVQTSAMVVTRDSGTHPPAEGWESCTVS